MDFDVGEEGAAAFRSLLGLKPIVSPLGETNDGAGTRSHFTYVQPWGDDPGWHVTTQLRGLGAVDRTYLGDIE